MKFASGYSLMADKIEQLTKLLEQSLAQMGFAGRQQALENFTAKACLPKTIAIIENVAIHDVQ